MKKESLFWIIITALIAGTLIVSAVLPKEQPMAIDFTNTASQRIYFDNSLSSLSQKSVFVWVDIDSFGDTSTGAYLLSRLNTSLPVSWYLSIHTESERFAFGQNTGTTEQPGIWGTDVGSATTGKHLFVVTFDSTSTLNTPVFYIDGVQVTTNMLFPPTGTFISDSNYTFSLGGYITLKPLDGRVLMSRVYNRILTPAEVALIYSARGKDNIRNGLVFCPQLIGAKGLQVFDGATLAAGNTIIDPCTGSSGVPNGNPVAVGETYLSIK